MSPPKELCISITYLIKSLSAMHKYIINICVYVHQTCMYMNKYINICIYKHESMYMYESMDMYANMSHMYECMHVCVCAYAYTCICRFSCFKIIFIYLLHKNIQQCTKGKCLKVLTSTSTFFQLTCEIMHIIYFIYW